MLHEAPDWESVDLTSRIGMDSSLDMFLSFRVLFRRIGSCVFRFCVWKFIRFLFFFILFFFYLAVTGYCYLIPNYLYSHQLPLIPVSNIFSISPYLTQITHTSIQSTNLSSEHTTHHKPPRRQHNNLIPHSLPQYPILVHHDLLIDE